MICPKTLSGIHSPDLNRPGHGCWYCGAAPGKAELARVKTDADRLTTAAEFVNGGQQKMTL